MQINEQSRDKGIKSTKDNNRPSVYEVKAIQDRNLSLEKFLGVERIEPGEGRRRLSLAIGSMDVTVDEIAAEVLSEKEKELIGLTRGSYKNMWGERVGEGLIDSDPTDGGVDSVYRTKHYIGRINVGGNEQRVITKKLVSLDPEKIKDLSPNQVESLLPDDLAFWDVRDTTSGETQSLWNELGDYFKKANSQETDTMNDSRLRIRANQRTAVYPHNIGAKTEIEKEKMPIVWSAMELLMTDDPETLLIACQLCDEFKERVLKIRDIKGQSVMLDFSKTADILCLPPEQKLELNSKADFLKRTAPGYWIDNTGAANVLVQLIADGKLDMSDFQTIYQKIQNDFGDKGQQKLQEILKKYGLGDSHENIIYTRGSLQSDESTKVKKIAEFLTDSRLFKYLVPWLNIDGVINSNLSGQELQDALLHRAGDGPYSSFLIPDLWRLTNLQLLEAAKLKYAGS